MAQVDVLVNAPRSRVWRLVTDIENAPQVISGIEKVEILERPSSGINGLKWVETRMMFGKPATETMWITNAVENSHYTTEARSHGAQYETEVRLSDEGASTRLTMRFKAIPESAVSKFMGIVFGPLMKRSVSKALRKDLEDIRAAAESDAA